MELLGSAGLLPLGEQVRDLIRCSLRLDSRDLVGKVLLVRRGFFRHVYLSSCKCIEISVQTGVTTHKERLYKTSSIRANWIRLVWKVLPPPISVRRALVNALTLRLSGLSR